MKTMGLPVEIRVPAKINLWLEVLGKRSDGYHELSSLMVPIAIYDHLALQTTSGQIGLVCSHRGVPQNADNLAWRAAELYRQRAGLKLGVQIRLHKNIPVGAGLGGGSADAGAVLLAMNQLCGQALSLEQLHEVARQLGADVPFFLHQQPMLATGIGEKLQPVAGVPSYPLVLIKPPVFVSTRSVYQRLKLTRGVSRIKIAAFLAYPWRLQGLLENDLESVTAAEYSVLAAIKQWLLDHGAVAALMSGSGPTVFGVFRSLEAARRVGQQARQAWSTCWVATAWVPPDASAEEV